MNRKATMMRAMVDGLKVPGRRNGIAIRTNRQKTGQMMRQFPRYQRRRPAARIMADRWSCLFRLTIGSLGGGRCSLVLRRNLRAFQEWPGLLNVIFFFGRAFGFGSKHLGP